MLRRKRRAAKFRAGYTDSQAEINFLGLFRERWGFFKKMAQPIRRAMIAKGLAFQSLFVRLLVTILQQSYSFCQRHQQSYHNPTLPWPVIY